MFQRGIGSFLDTTGYLSQTSLTQPGVRLHHGEHGGRASCNHFRPVEGIKYGEIARVGFKHGAGNMASWKILYKWRLNKWLNHAKNGGFSS